MPPLLISYCFLAWPNAKTVCVSASVVVSPSGPLLHLRLQCDTLPQSLLRQADTSRLARPPAAWLPQAQGQVWVLWQRVHRWSLRGKQRRPNLFLFMCNSTRTWHKQLEWRHIISMPVWKMSLWKTAGKTNARVSLLPESVGLFWNNTCVGRRKETLTESFILDVFSSVRRLKYLRVSSRTPLSFQPGCLSHVYSGPHGLPCAHSDRGINLPFGFCTGITCV